MTEVQFEAQIGGQWRDLVARDQVRVQQAVTIKRAAAGVGEALRPAAVTAQLDNTFDDLRPSNPESDLYQTAGVGTPIRVSRDGEVRGCVQARTWVADESPDFRVTPKRGSAWVNVAGAGALDQAMSGPKLQSPFTRYAKVRASNVGLWPLEDPSGAAAAANLVAGGRLATVYGAPTFGSSERPPGSESSVQMAAGARLTGVFSDANSSTWRIGVQARIPATLTASYLPLFKWTDSNGRYWSWEINNANTAIRVVDGEGAAISFEVTARSYTADQWVQMYIYAVVSGITLTYDVAFDPVSGTANGMVKNFTSSVTGNLRTWEIPDNVYTNGSYFSQVHGLYDAGDSGADYAAFLGHADEPAGWRFARLMYELGFAWSWIGDPDDTVPMGPQQADTVGELLREIQDTEDGLIFDKRDALEIVMMTRVARYNQTAIPVYLSDLNGRPAEVTDTSISNTVTVTNRVGGESLAVDVSGPLGVTAKGILEADVKVNVYPDRILDSLANWYLRRFTVNQPRYPSITIKLSALDAARQEELRALDVGDVIEISGLRADPVRLHILGLDEVIGWPNAHWLTLTCQPDDLFNSGVYDAARYDSSSTTLAAVAEIGQTGISLTTVRPGDVWSTTSLPYSAVVAGERVTVTGMTSASGAGPYTQTATVVRSVNGVRKRLPAGSEFHIADPARYALREV